MAYTFYVDESGDLGLDVVRQGAFDKGASPYLVLGGCLVANNRKDIIREKLQRLQLEVCKGKNLHCAELSHLQIAKLAREVASFEGILLFAFVSGKGTIGSYKGAIEGREQSNFYFNKCSVYLLEQFAHAMETFQIKKSEVSIVFETRNQSYQQMRQYVRQSIATPYSTGHALADERRKRLQQIDYLSITDQPKNSEILLFLADIVAYATRQAVEHADYNFGIPEQRYLRELKSKFFKCKETGAIGDWGLNVFKRHKLKFDPMTKAFITAWYKKT